jgi:hypothetical protein
MKAPLSSSCGYRRAGIVEVAATPPTDSRLPVLQARDSAG